MLKGTLDDFTLPDIFRLMSYSKKTGRLDVERQAGTGKVFFREGDVYYAESSLSRDPIGQKLLRSGSITESQLRKALDEQAASGDRIGQILVSSGAVEEQDLEAAVRMQIEDAIFDLLRWELGEFDWEPGAEVEAEVPLSVSVENLIMEASRRLDELEVMKRKVPSFNSIPAMVPRPPEGAAEINITPQEWRVLVLVDGVRSVEDIAEIVGVDRFEGMRVLYGLASAGLIEVTGEAEEVAAEEDLAAEEPGEAAFDDETADPTEAVADGSSEVEASFSEPALPEIEVEETPEQDETSENYDITSEFDTASEAEQESQEDDEAVEPYDPSASLYDADDLESEIQPEVLTESQLEEELHPSGTAFLDDGDVLDDEADDPPSALDDATAVFDDPAAHTEVTTYEPSGLDALEAELAGQAETAEPAAAEAADLDLGIPSTDEDPTDEGESQRADVSDQDWLHGGEVELDGFGSPSDTSVTDAFLNELLQDAQQATPPAEGHETEPEPDVQAEFQPGQDAVAADTEDEEAPFLDRAAAVRELAGLFDDDEPRPRAVLSSPRPSSDDAGNEKRKRVEDDEQVTKGLIARLINGVKGL